MATEQNAQRCLCGWTIRRKGLSWQHVGAGTVMCPPQAMWSNPNAWRPGAKGQPAPQQYPRVNEQGDTVWACCESAIGPACPHKQGT